MGPGHGDKCQGPLPWHQVRHPRHEASWRRLNRISSVAGFVASPYSGGAYGASKGALRLFTKVTAIQHAKDKIRCNSVHPGPVDTPMLSALPDQASQEMRLRGIPLGRIGTSEDIAFGVLYLASDESSFVTGTELAIDGGRTAQ